MLKLRSKYQVWYQRQLDMVVSWIFVDARYKEEAREIASNKLKGENILHIREV